MAKQFTVGQTLFFVPRNYEKPANVTITKVGRTWLQLSNGSRCSFDLVVDSEYGSPPTCYLSQTVFDDEQALAAAWRRLGSELSRRAPAGITIEKIAQARAMLGL